METNTKFAQSLKLDYPVLSDPEKQTAAAWGVVSARRTVPQRWTFYIGKDGTVLHIDKDVNPATHGADVSKKLEELGIEKKE